MFAVTILELSLLIQSKSGLGQSLFNRLSPLTFRHGVFPKVRVHHFLPAYRHLLDTTMMLILSKDALLART